MEHINSIFVDLGLPSGTKWAKYNYGANSESEDGGHYSWDEAMELPITLPSKEQFQELYDNTTSVWIENYKGNCISGRLFVSKINGNTIFFPASGYCVRTNLLSRGSYGGYWSSSICSNYKFAYSLYFSCCNVYPQRGDYRCIWFSVRGVSE